MTTPRIPLGRSLLAVAAIVVSASAWADLPTVLTDDIKQGNGTIDVMKDVTAAELSDVLGGGTLYLGADLNEDNSGIESALSQGVAVKEVELILTTTEGTFSFSNFYTNTTAMIKEAGSASAAEYNTLFGQTGSSQLTSGSSGFDLSTFDDVIEIRDVYYTGEITGAQIRIAFLDTNKKAGDNENFFDYSAGFEDFAILSAADAQLLDNANIGLAAAPSTVTYTATAPSGGVITAPGGGASAEPGGGDIAAPRGAPEPHLLLLAAIPALLLLRRRRSGASAALPLAT